MKYSIIAAGVVATMFAGVVGASPSSESLCESDPDKGKAVKFHFLTNYSTIFNNVSAIGIIAGSGTNGIQEHDIKKWPTSAQVKASNNDNLMCSGKVGMNGNKTLNISTTASDTSKITLSFVYNVSVLKYTVQCTVATKSMNAHNLPQEVTVYSSDMETSCTVIN